MFKRCDFLLGDNQAVVIVLPACLPRADTYTVAVTEKRISFRAGYDEIAELPCPDSDVFRRIASHTQIGLVEFPEGAPFPGIITNMAYVEVRKALP
ncbi:MAG: hypothetical protein KDJ15_03000 [Alphaproteobacteria bacterium]|nr:hypothetical protein [Alphaproteobacteria bacterium]